MIAAGTIDLGAAFKRAATGQKQFLNSVAFSSEKTPFRNV